VFTDLGLFMMGFGLAIGVIFPFFMLLLGVPKQYVLNDLFFISCISAGILVGAINYLLSRGIVGRRLQELAAKMTFISGRLNSKMSNDEIEACTQDKCLVTVDSDDEIGESSQAFNTLVQALSHSLKTENSIKEFNEMLSTQMEVQGLTQKALDQLVDTMEADGGAILLEKGGDLTIGASYAIKDIERLTQNDSIWKAMKLQKRQLLQMPKGILVDHSLVEFHPCEIMIEPLVYKDIALGVVLLAFSRPCKDHLTYGFEMCIRNLTLSLRNAVTYEQLQQLAANDPLTGIYNRRFGMVRLKEEFNRSVRSNVPLGVLMFDIDHFKAVNDTYGHTVGDKILISVTRIAKLALREGDILLRYGGEEFLVIMPGASRQDSEFVANRLCRMIEEGRTQQGEQSISVTVSVGVCSYPERDVTQGSELITHADTALYEAKEHGRNCVVIK
jgi:two-component system, cell cycle response regulator